VKLADASKLFGKKFAAGASITKSPQDVEQIEVRIRKFSTQFHWESRNAINA